jgi:hypothetical protein
MPLYTLYPKGSGYTAGKEAPTAALNCVLRSGHTDAEKTEMSLDSQSASGAG